MFDDEFAGADQALGECGDEEPVHCGVLLAEEFEIVSVEGVGLGCFEGGDAAGTPIVGMYECELTYELTGVDDPERDERAGGCAALDVEPAGSDDVEAVADVTVVEQNLTASVAAGTQPCLDQGSLPMAEHGEQLEVHATVSRSEPCRGLRSSHGRSGGTVVDATVAP